MANQAIRKHGIQKPKKRLFLTAAYANSLFQIVDEKKKSDQKIGLDLYYHYLFVLALIKEDYFAEKIKLYSQVLEKLHTLSVFEKSYETIELPFIKKSQDIEEVISWFNNYSDYCVKVKKLYPDLVPWDNCLRLLSVLKKEKVIYENILQYQQKLVTQENCLELIQELKSIYTQLENFISHLSLTICELEPSFRFLDTIDQWLSNLPNDPEEYTCSPSSFSR